MLPPLPPQHWVVVFLFIFRNSTREIQASLVYFFNLHLFVEAF